MSLREGLLVRSESTGFALFSDDLERRCDDSNEQVGEPKHHDHNASAKEKCRVGVVGTHGVIHEVRECICAHDDKDELKRVENVVEIDRSAKRIALL